MHEIIHLLAISYVKHRTNLLNFLPLLNIIYLYHGYKIFYYMHNKQKQQTRTATCDDTELKECKSPLKVPMEIKTKM